MVVSVLTILIVTLSAGKVPLIVNPVICYIGKISYSCYLVHFAALGIALKILGVNLTADQRFHDGGSSFSNLLLFLKIFCIGLLLTIPIATITLHLIENPGIKLGRRLLDWITRAEAKEILPMTRRAAAAVE
jgi:peptidoglycan/LPS O-acetylase OafA/YrhL